MRAVLARLVRPSVNLIPLSFRSKIRDAPVAARFQRFIVNKFLARQEFVHVINAGPAKGLVYPVTLPKDKNIWTGTYERNFATALAGNVRRGDVCYDVGGFRGFMSGVCGRAGGGLVVVFEPLAENCRQILRMIELNPNLTIRLEPIAVGDCDGEVEFKVMADDSMGKLALSPFQPEAKGAASRTVRIRRLDSLVAEGLLPSPNVIKLDVEGAELLVLRGALQILRQHHPRVLIEAHSADLARDCTDLLKSMGYGVSMLRASFEPNPPKEQEVCHLLAQPDDINGRPINSRNSEIDVPTDLNSEHK